MEDLIDIQGLDAVTWWPLALGWWIIIALAIIVASLSIYYLWRKFKYRRSWQYKSAKKLEKMHTQLGQIASKKILQDLSSELRKIAMLTTQRETCAGLIGKQWLQWLKEHDPSGFNWVDNGLLLTDLQYMPEAAVSDSTQVAILIDAAHGWVKKC